MVKKIYHEINKKRREILLYGSAINFYNDLERCGIIERTKGISQLGTISVPKKIWKSKFDYIMYQLYLISIISGNKMRDKLKISTGNKFKTIRETTFSIGETLEILVLINGIGHFNTTFAASKAVVQLCIDSPEFKEVFFKSFEEEDDKRLAQKIIDTKDYMHIHLLNSLIMISTLNDSNYKTFAQEIIHNYLENEVADEFKTKWEYIMSVFRVVRNISFNSLDLQVADLPYSINIHEEKQVLRLLEEGLSEYNDNTPTYSLISSVTKLLGDTLYFAPDVVINQQFISDRIVRKMLCSDMLPNYTSYLFDPDSLFNKTNKRAKRFDHENYLKLTLPKTDSQKLYNELKSIEFVRCGYYDRGSTKQTIILSIDEKSCRPEYIALRILRCVLKHLRELRIIDNIGNTNRIESSDNRYLLVTKYFLRYMLHAIAIRIDGTLDPQKCVLCTMGSKSRIYELPDNKSNQNDNIVHEVDFLKKRLENDMKNDIAITIPASIKTKSTFNGKKEHEFDGMIIFPNRKEKQLVFLEAKNWSIRKGNKRADDCLIEKLDDNGIEYNRNDIIVDGKDAYMYYSVPSSKMPHIKND
jgi:hypothetical protein